MLDTYISPNSKIYNSHDKDFKNYQFKIFFNSYGVLMIKNVNFIEKGVFCLTMNKDTFNQNFYIK